MERVAVWAEAFGEATEEEGEKDSLQSRVERIQWGGLRLLLAVLSLPSGELLCKKFSESSWGGGFP